VLKPICQAAFSFAPAGAWENFNANRIPRLAAWAKIFRPSGPERAMRNKAVSRGKSQRQKASLRQPRILSPSVVALQICSSASSISRFLCLGGLLRGFSSRRVGGGCPARSRAWRFTSFHPLNGSFFGGLLGLIGTNSIAVGPRSCSGAKTAARS
jgi:hypothetical protein